MTFALSNNFLANARGITYKDANGITWAFDPSTNQVTASYSGAGSAGAANPTAKVGLSAVNGIAATFMRSDAAPPLDLTISPTWAGNHTFTAAAGPAVTITAASTSPQLIVGGAVNATQSALIAGVTFSYGDLLLAGSAEISSTHALNIGTNAAVALGLYTNGALRLTVASGGAVTVAGNFAINNGTPAAPLSGFGTPSGAVTAGLTSSATLAQTAGTLAALLAYLKTIGVIAA